MLFKVGCDVICLLSFLFVCLEFFVPLENFHSFGDVPIAGEGLQNLTYARHLWPLSSGVLLRGTPTVTRGIRL